MTLQEIARHDTVTATPEMTVQEAAQRLGKHNIGSIVVVEGDTPVGMVTDRDLALKVVGQGRDPTSVSVETIMSSPVHTIEASAGMYEAIDEMAEHAIRRLPVVDADGALVGILTIDDLMGVMTSEIALLESVLLSQSKRTSFGPEGGR